MKYGSVEEITKAFIRKGWSKDTKFAKASAEDINRIYGCITPDKKRNYFVMDVTGNVFDDNGKVALYNLGNKEDYKELFSKDREIYNALVKECGNPITVTDADKWFDVKALGTYEFGPKDNELWTMQGKLYRLCFALLPETEKETVLELTWK